MIVLGGLGWEYSMMLLLKYDRTVFCPYTMEKKKSQSLRNKRWGGVLRVSESCRLLVLL